MTHLISDYHARRSSAPSASDRRQLADYLREQILSGRIPAGAKLPPGRRISQDLGVAESSVQAAMTILVKEGLVDRVRKRGTFVRQQAPQPLMRVGVYSRNAVLGVTGSAFARLLVQQIHQQLEARSIGFEPFIDFRPEPLRQEPLESLARAAMLREIQGLIVADASAADIAALRKLAVPAVFLTPLNLPGAVGLGGVFAGAMAALERRKVTSVGLISAVPRDQTGRAVLYYDQFFQLARVHGLDARPSWVEAPDEGVPSGDAEHFGYEAFQRLWSQPERPQALIVITDVTARGVLMALSRAHVRVPADLQLVLQRNAELGLLCPVPATFIDTHVAEVAAALIQQLERVCRGETPGRIEVEPHLVEDDPTNSSPSQPQPGARPAGPDEGSTLSQEEA
jgi:DNA-binding LacI/PurR family transcriptional regulator